MKNILKHFILIAVTILGTVSCEYDETSFDLQSDAPDPNATYYIQFKNASKSLQTGVAEDGSLVDISTTVTVGLLGLPRTEATVVNFTIDPATTISPNMYQLSATSITIPAGETTGSISLVTNTELMPVAEVLKFILNVDAGENTATAGTRLEYKLERINFCLLTLSDYVGTWTGTDSWGYPTEVTTSLVGGKLMMNGIGFGWFQDWWGEVIVTNNPVEVDVNLITGDFVINDAKQTVPYLVSTYLGALQPAYKIKASGKITSTCEQIIEFTYSFDQGGYFNGTAWGPAFKEVIKHN
ncbi:MAG: hypothetical protein A3F91_10620 [Flavobacteria bacterium RIFCSPLOWO2_12_FULL_35_11]|nr:MAG: hypothetical protein A3F91_10620 [Flavobacteria bacterium RIFCSPLOWO2_12_FULL_35_11]